MSISLYESPSLTLCHNSYLCILSSLSFTLLSLSLSQSLSPKNFYFLSPHLLLRIFTSYLHIFSQEFLLPISTSSPKNFYFLSPISTSYNSINDDLSISQSVNQSVSQSVNQSISQRVSQSVSQCISQSISQSINQSFNRSINQSIRQSFKKSINKSINWSISHLIHRQSCL